jgi:hypothetical protein
LKFFREDSLQRKIVPIHSVHNPSASKLKSKHEKSESTEDLRMFSHQPHPEEQPDAFYKGMICFHFVIGKGGFGKVWMVEMRKTKMLFALKEMSKAK